MRGLINKRKSLNISQRRLAKKAGISYKALQLIESGKHDARLSTLEKIFVAINLPKTFLKEKINSFFKMPADSVEVVSYEMAYTNDWEIYFFNFVDVLRKKKDESLIENPPYKLLPIKLKALLASAVEMLCVELGMNIPYWCEGLSSLDDPYFVSGIENLKAMALVESPPYFKKRNIFVLANFLQRA